MNESEWTVRAKLAPSIRGSSAQSAGAKRFLRSLQKTAKTADGEDLARAFLFRGESGRTRSTFSQESFRRRW
jgi:hypothetical protein